MAENEGKEQFKQMMALSEFGAMQRNEGTVRIFKMFVSYMTFLVAVAGFILISHRNEKNIDPLSAFAGIIVLVGMICVYRNWLETAYGSVIYSLRRRDFYLKKAEIICYHASRELDWDFSACEDVYVNLGSGRHRKTSEQRLITKARAPDIENCLDKKNQLCGDLRPDTMRDDDKFFKFNWWFPLLLTVFNVGALFFMVIFGLIALLAC